VASFYLACFPVTNAEYNCFIQAGGYDTEHYWTPTGWQWRQRHVESSGLVEDALARRQSFLNNPADIEKWLKDGRLTPDDADTWRAFLRLSGEEARQQLLQAFPIQSHDLLHYRADPAYNAPNQPVVGVTWYEAMAYGAWLHKQLATSGQPCTLAGVPWDTLLTSGSWQVRLATEAEWEWAAGGQKPRRYAWGQTFTVELANTLEGRVLALSPVGAYPTGAAACGALDMSGNVWEWTHSL